MSTDTKQPQGKSMRELREIVAKDNARFDRIAAVWGNLTDDEQKELVHCAEAMAASETDCRHESGWNTKP